jgi:quinol monooxygenase YgiN
MIITTVKLFPRKEHKQNFLNAFQEVSAIVYKEEGCIEYEIYPKDDVASDLFIFERWESQLALDRHLKTKHMSDFFAKTATWFEKENEMQTYQIK